MVYFHLSKSKCDLFGKGMDIILGGMDWNLCLVASVMIYIVTRGGCQRTFFPGHGVDNHKIIVH